MSEPTCARSSKHTPEWQCEKCIYRHAGGDPMEPLVKVIRDTKDRVVEIDCLTGRRYPLSERWRYTTLGR